MIRGFTLLAAGAMAVSGLALTIGTLAAVAFVGHNSPSASLIVAITVLLVVVGVALALSRTLLHLQSGSRTRPLPPGPPPVQSYLHERACPRQP
jgi:membrane protein implicated in regulation of membrane protease activity